MKDKQKQKVKTLKKVNYLLNNLGHPLDPRPEIEKAEEIEEFEAEDTKEKEKDNG